MLTVREPTLKLCCVTARDTTDEHLGEDNIWKTSKAAIGTLIYFIKLSQQYKADIRAGWLSFKTYMSQKSERRWRSNHL